jgi:Family of unknown function (DUF6282)
MLSLEGAIDLHVHAAPEVFGRIGDAVQIGKRCEAAGMRAVVFMAVACSGAVLRAAALPPQPSGGRVRRGPLRPPPMKDPARLLGLP